MTKKTSSSDTIKVNILKPFGPRILHAKLPKKTIKMLNEECDIILKTKSRNKEDFNHDLLRQVTSDAFQIDMREKPTLRDFALGLGDLTKCLVDEYQKEKNPNYVNDNASQFYMHNAWFVRSFKSDYLPVHLHTSGQFSCVLYLKVPEDITETDNKNTQGYIDFIYGSANTVTRGNRTFMPVVGDLYIFPSFLFHTAYPFFGKGERRSLSANFSLQLKDVK